MGKMISAYTKDTDHCIVCGRRREHWHHVYGASDKKSSEKFHYLLPLCGEHHNLSDNGIHFNHEMDYHYKQLGYEMFKRDYPTLRWLDYFRKQYEKEI